MNYVMLNNKRIEIQGKVLERQVTPWSSKISMGSKNFADFLPCSIREYSDLTGGIGLDSESVETNRIMWSESIETTKSGELTLGPEVVAVGDFNAVPLKMIEFGTVQYAFSDGGSFYNNSETWTATGDPSPLSSPTDALVFKDATDSYLIVCNGSDVRYASVGYGDSQDWATLSTSDVKYMCSFDKRLIGINSTGSTVYYSDRDNCDNAAGGEMDSFSISGDWTEVYDLWSGLLPTVDEDGIYMLTDVGLYVIDFWTRIPYKQHVRYPKTSNALVGMCWNGNVYCATGSGISVITPDNKVNPDFGPDADSGLPSQYVGYIYDMIGLSNWIVICVSNASYSTILKRHVSKGGWHEVYSGSSNIRCLMWSGVTAPGYLYFQLGSDIYKLQFPDTTHDITKVEGYTYNSGEDAGILIYPALRSVSTIPKTVVAIGALTAGLDANVNIKVYGRTDDDITSDIGENWTLYGTFTSNGHPPDLSINSGYGYSFNDIQLKAAFTTNSNSSTPTLKSLVMKYITNPPVVTAWEFNIAARGKEAKQIIADLEAARDSSTLVNFSPVGDLAISTKYVRIEALPSVHDLDDYATEKNYTVRVTEVE